MAEWLKAHAWKACVRETVPWVRIPLSPPSCQNRFVPGARDRLETRPFSCISASGELPSVVHSGLNEAGEPNFLRILEPAKLVWYGISRKINGLPRGGLDPSRPSKAAYL